MLTLYHCHDARSFRPLWTLEEMGLPYELKMLPFPPRATVPDYLSVNPLGTVPTFFDGNMRMTESAAICQYISRPTYHRLRAEGRGPVEMRVGLNLIRITAQAERDWQQQLQRPSADLERRARARAVKAGGAAVKSDKHISIRKRRVAR